MAEPLPASRFMPLYCGARRRASLDPAAIAARHAQGGRSPTEHGARRRRLTAAPPTIAGPGRRLPAAHDASTAKRSPKTNENSLRAVCQKGGGRRHLLSTPRSAK